jgi:hypothetical protein
MCVVITRKEVMPRRPCGFEHHNDCQPAVCGGVVDGGDGPERRDRPSLSTHLDPFDIPLRRRGSHADVAEGPRGGSRQTFEEQSGFQQTFIATSSSLIEASLFVATSVMRCFDGGILGVETTFPFSRPGGLNEVVVIRTFPFDGAQVTCPIFVDTACQIAKHWVGSSPTENCAP